MTPSSDASKPSSAARRSLCFPVWIACLLLVLGYLLVSFTPLPSVVFLFWALALGYGHWRLSRETSNSGDTSELLETIPDLHYRFPETGSDDTQRLHIALNKLLQTCQNERMEGEVRAARKAESAHRTKVKVERLVAYLKESLDSLGDALVLIDDSASSVLFANRTARTWLEPDETRPLAGVTTSDFIDRGRLLFDQTEAWDSLWDVCLEHPEQQIEVDFHIREPQERILSVLSAPVRRQRTTVIGRLVLIRDLTHARQMERGLREAQKMEAVGQLAGGIAHDFNNILTAIRGSLTVIEMDIEDGTDPAGDIKTGMDACDRAAHLVSQLLGFSRKSQLTLANVDTNKVVSEIVPLIKYTLKTNIDLRMDLADQSLPIKADSNQLDQVVMNLCVNARDAMPDGGRLQVRTFMADLKQADCALSGDAYPGRFAAIEVSDTGTGMSEEVRLKIFEPFFTTKEPGKGTGLGLATSYGIINQHGGWIACDSVLGRGTTFTMYFPIDGKVEEVHLPANGEAPPAKIVLVVDDEEAVRRLTCRILQRKGYATHEAEDGIQAIEYLKAAQRKPDLMVLDLTMPHLTGAETWRTMIEEKLQIPVIVCSAYSNEISKIAEADGPRPDDFITKPFSPPDLIRSVRDLIGKS